MKNIRKQAHDMGHDVAGALKRMPDDVFERNGEEIRHRIYLDAEGVEYAVSWRGNLVYIAGEDWVI